MKKLLPILLAILITNSVFGQSARLPTTGLLAWYPFCFNSSDQSGNGYDLTNTGGPVIATDRFGNPNTAYSFNGGTGDLDFGVPFFSAAGFTTSDYTYSCWIFPAGVQSSVIWYNGNPTTDGYGIYMNNGTMGTPGSNVEIVFGGGIGTFLSTTITTSQWHHLVFNKNGNAFRFYIDGAPVGSFAPVTSFVVPSGRFTLGQDYVNPGISAFNGLIDDVAIYSRFVNTFADTSAINDFNPDITPFNLGILAADTGICVNTLTLTPSPAFDTSYHYLWSNGDSAASITTTVVPNPGSTFYLTITKPYGCSLTESAHAHEIKVVVDLGPANKVFCTTEEAVLHALPVYPSETFLWSTGETTDSIAVTSDGKYWISVDSAGCSGSDTINVTILPPVLVDLGQDTLTCDGSPITLKSSYIYPAGTTFLWGGTPIPGGVTTSVSYTFTQSGTYWLTVSQGACVGSDTAVVGVVYDSLILNTPDTSVCQGQSVQIRAHGNPAATNSWTPTTGIASAFSVNPVITPDTSAWYIVDASLNGCHVKDSLYINVEPVPHVYIGGNRNVCRGDTIHITASVTPAWFTHYVYNWTPGLNLDHSMTTASDSALGTVVFTAGDSTNLILTVTTPFAAFGCIGVDSAEIMVHTPHDTALFDASICPGDSVILNPRPTIGNTFTWHPAMYLSDSTATHPIARPINTIDYWVQSTDRFGCHDTLFQTIIVHPNAVMYLGDSVNLHPGEQFQISPQTNCVNFSWSPYLGLNDTSASNPLASPAVSTKYIVKASTEWGCVVMDSINLHVDPTAWVAVPNAFTPGNGINNVLKVLTRGAVQLHYFRIYNRWGNKVFETSNLADGWDGMFNGSPQPFGVYVYDIEAVTNEGSVFHNTGNVTLIR